MVTVTRSYDVLDFMVHDCVFLYSSEICTLQDSQTAGTSQHKMSEMDQ